LDDHAVHNPIVWPMIAQAGLTAAVWVALYSRRIAEMRTRRITPQSIATSHAAATRVRDLDASGRVALARRIATVRRAAKG
jgi:hypothetical protein